MERIVKAINTHNITRIKRETYRNHELVIDKLSRRASMRETANGYSIAHEEVKIHILRR